MQPFPLIWMRKQLFICFVFFSSFCHAQECSELLEAVESGEYEHLLELLEQKPPEAGDHFFTSCLAEKDLSLCDRTSLTRVYSKLLLLYELPIAAVEKAKQALDLNKVCKSEEEDIEINLLLADIYKSQGKLEVSLQYYLTASWLAENTSPSFTTYLIHRNAAELQYEARNYNEAMQLLKTAMQVHTKHPEIFNTRKKKFALMDGYNTMALCYRNSNTDPEAAIRYFKMANGIAREIKDEFWESLTQGNIGTIYYKLSKFDSAKYYLQVDARISRKHEEWLSLANAYYMLGSICEVERKTTEAVLYYDSIGTLLGKIRSLNYPDYFKKLSELNYQKGNYKAATDYSRIYHSQKDSLAKLEASKNLSLIQQKYDFDKKLADLELIKKDNELKEKELSVQRGLLFGTVSTVLLLFVLIYLVVRRYNQKRRIEKLLQQQIEERTRELTELNLELDTFLYRASHDFRGPLSTIMGLNHLGMMTIKDKDAHEIIKRVGDVARVMDKMLGKIASIHIINREVGNVSEIPLYFRCQDIIDDLNVNDPSITIENAIPTYFSIRTEYKLLRIILDNVLENAVKFRKFATHLYVHIAATVVDSTSIQIVVSDNGKGIDASVVEKIFQPFYRAENEQGNGLGLFLVKKCIEKLNGDIFMESQVGVGTTVKIRLPHLDTPKFVEPHGKRTRMESYKNMLKRVL